MQSVTIQSDNGSAYNSKLFVLLLGLLRHHCPIRVKRLIHTEPGEGKSILDGLGAIGAMWCRQWLRSGRDLSSPHEYAAALAQCCDPSVRVLVLKYDTRARDILRVIGHGLDHFLVGIHDLREFVFEDDSILCYASSGLTAIPTLVIPMVDVYAVFSANGATWVSQGEKSDVGLTGVRASEVLADGPLFTRPVKPAPAGYGVPVAPRGPNRLVRARLAAQAKRDKKDDMLAEAGWLRCRNCTRGERLGVLCRGPINLANHARSCGGVQDRGLVAQCNAVALNILLRGDVTCDGAGVTGAPGSGSLTGLGLGAASQAAFGVGWATSASRRVAAAAAPKLVATPELEEAIAVYARGLTSGTNPNMHWHVLRSNLERDGQFTDVPAEEDLEKFFDVMVKRADPRVARGKQQSYNSSRGVLVGMLVQRGLSVDGVILELSARLRADDARRALGGLAPFVPGPAADGVPARDGIAPAAAQPRPRTYASLAKPALVASCVARGLDSTGTAATIRARLVAQDAQDNAPAAAGGGNGASVDGVQRVVRGDGDALAGGDGDDAPGHGGVVRGDGDALAGGDDDDAPGHGGVVRGDGDALAGGDGDDAPGHGGVVRGDGDALAGGDGDDAPGHGGVVRGDGDAPVVAVGSDARAGGDGGAPALGGVDVDDANMAEVAAIPSNSKRKPPADFEQLRRGSRARVEKSRE